MPLPHIYLTAALIAAAAFATVALRLIQEAAL